MSERTVQIKLVVLQDIHLKQREEIDAEITIPSEHGGICTTQIHDSLVMMVGGSNNAMGRAAAIAMGLVKEPL
jgi:hypothetical protein